MSDGRNDPSSAVGREETEGRVRSLIRSAGPRLSMPADVEERLFRSSYAEWRQSLRARRRVRIMYATAATCAVLAVAALVVLALDVRGASRALVAMTTTGQVTVQRGDRDRGIDPGGRVDRGDTVRTGPHSSVVLRRDDGLELRLGEKSVLAWAGTSARLSDGHAYVESHATTADRVPLALNAGELSISHVGTEYLVEQSAATTVVAVRDGAVAVAGGASRKVVLAGGAVRWRDGSIEPLSAGTGVDWAWADALGAPLEIEGRSVDEVLVEATRRGGLAVRYDDSETRSRARSVTLRGTALHLPPREAVRAVLAAGGFAGGIDGSVVVVRTR